jgi:hypothetical protein
MRFRPANIRLINRRSNPAPTAARPVLGKQQKQRQTHRFAVVDTVTPYQGNTLRVLPCLSRNAVKLRGWDCGQRLADRGCQRASAPAWAGRRSGCCWRAPESESPASTPHRASSPGALWKNRAFHILRLCAGEKRLQGKSARYARGGNGTEVMGGGSERPDGGGHFAGKNSIFASFAAGFRSKSAVTNT